MKVSINIEGINAAQAMRVTSLLEGLGHEATTPPVPQPSIATTEATTPPVPQPSIATTQAPAASVPQPPVATAETAPATPVPQPPVATAETAPTLTEGVELDKDGVPWDGRIHAKTRSKTAKGLWKKLKGVDYDLYEKLTTAYKANSTTETTQAPATPVPQPPVATAETAPAASVPQPPVAMAETAPAASVPQPPVAMAETAPVEGLIQTAQVCDCRTDISHEQMMTQVNVALADPNNPVGPVDLPKITSAFDLQTLVDCANDPVTIGKIYHVLGGQ